MEQQIVTTGTASANLIHDLTRLDREYLVSIGHHFWIVWLTEEAQQALSKRLQNAAMKRLIPDCDDEATYSITCISVIRDHPDYVSMDEYLNELEAE